MPAFRKVPTEIAAAWQKARPAPARRDDRYVWVARPARLFVSRKPRPLVEPPQIGDVLQLRAAPETPLEQIVGVVLGVRTRQDGVWTHVHLAFNGAAAWVSKRTVAAHLGRMKGISRVDQPTKLIAGRVHGGTHGWFVRVYQPGQTPAILARTFSDRAAGGMLAALRAALAFHAAHVAIDAAEGVAFGSIG